jgi:site-specific DNA recombinase
MLMTMLTIGYVRVSTDRQAEKGVSLEAQEAKIRAMATVQGAELMEVIVDGGESAKSMNRPGLQKLLAMVNAGKVQAVIVAKLDRLTRSVKDLCGLLELFEKGKVALISVAEALDTGAPQIDLDVRNPASVFRKPNRSAAIRSEFRSQQKSGASARDPGAGAVITVLLNVVRKLTWLPAARRGFAAFGIRAVRGWRITP